MHELKFYFDYLSPYAFFAWQWVRDFCEEQDLELQAQPVPLGALLGHWGHLGPAEIPPKREFTFRNCLRIAARMELQLEMPKYHPFNPLTALRVSLDEVAGADQETVIDTLFDAGWQRGVDLGDDAVIRQALDDAGLDGESMVRRTQEPQVKEALKQTAGAALADGAFGVPTFILDGELFWGNDQREPMRRWADGDRGYDPDDLKRLLRREAAVRRKR